MVEIKRGAEERSVLGNSCLESKPGIRPPPGKVDAHPPVPGAVSFRPSRAGPSKPDAGGVWAGLLLGPRCLPAAVCKLGDVGEQDRKVPPDIKLTL